MKTKKENLSATRIKRIRAQGYEHQTDAEIVDLAFGNRFAYRLCVSILAVGVLLSNIPILSAMLVIAFLGVVLPNHPFDYIYNYFLAKWMNKPQLPARSKQLKFACGMATLTIGVTIYFIYANMTMAASIIGLSLVGVAGLVSTTDYCIPSVMYNAVFGKSAVKPINTLSE